MTRICLRILFWAGVALPLAHGCDDSEVACLGTAVACENREPSECNLGCELYEGCHGDPIQCDSLTRDPDLCLQLGCRYVGTCEGLAGCEGIEFELCGTTRGCTQVRRCYPGEFEAFRCEDLEDSQCELYSQCTLGSRCTGSAVPCEDLPSTAACIDAPGCLPADTTPSVID